MDTASHNPRVGDKITTWGYTFAWTEDHIPKEKLKPLRYECDTLGAETLERLQVIKASMSEDHKTKGTPAPPNDLYTLLRDHYHTDDVLTLFWEQVHTVPSWVDWDQLARAQKFFSRYAIGNIVGFALQGFVAENSASPGVVEVLVRTGGFSTRVLLNRLLETFQWLIQVTNDLESVQPGGEGHIATIRVRLLHASVRQRILRLCQTKPNYYNVEKFGLPVNTMDAIHSISTFSCNQLWLQLPKFGIQPTQQETEDYVALFRYLAHVIGTPTEYFETAEKGRLVMESCLLHELETTDTSRVVLFNFMECVGNLPPPFHVSRQFIEAGSRWINGDEHCDSLDLGRPGLIYQLAFVGHCILVAGLAWLQRLVPGLDEKLVKSFRNAMYQGIVMRKASTRFDFKYVPQGKNTGREVYSGDHHGVVEKKKEQSTLSYPDLSWITYMGYFELVLLSITLGTAVFMSIGVFGLGLVLQRAIL